MNQVGNPPSLAERVRFRWWRPSTKLPVWSELEDLRGIIPTAVQERCDNELWMLSDGDDGRFGFGPWLIVDQDYAYEPLREYPALFREFVSLPFSRDAYEGFARQYGSLMARFEQGLPDRLSTWVIEHHELRGAVMLADALAAHETENLEDLGISWEPARNLNGGPIRGHSLASFRYTPVTLYNLMVEHPEIPEDSQVLASLQSQMWETRTGTLLEADSGHRALAQAVLEHTISERMAQHGVTPMIARDGGTLGPGMHLSFRVPHLAGALWLQLLLAIDGNRTYRTCPVCGKWWDDTDARSHKAVCSNKCRAKRSYELRKAAKEEAAENGESS